MFRIKIKKSTRFWTHMLASGSIVALAIYGWGFTISDALRYLLLILLSLTAIVGLAALMGWLLGLKHKKP